MSTTIEFETKKDAQMKLWEKGYTFSHNGDIFKNNNFTQVWGLWWTTPNKKIGVVIFDEIPFEVEDKSKC